VGPGAKRCQPRLLVNLEVAHSSLIGESRLQPEEACITCAIVDAAARVRDLNFKYMSEGKGATVTARFGKDGITLCDPNRASEGADKVFQCIYDEAI